MSPLTKIPTTVTESFISEYPNFLNKNECNMFIDAFQFYKKTGYVTQAGFRSKDGDVRVDPNLRSETNYVFVSDFMFHAVNHSPGHIVTNFFTKLGPVIDDYMDQFGAAIPNLQIQSQDIKVQEVKPTGGYHVWHSEWAPPKYLPANRMFVWMVYLTDHEGEGDTEFLYQGIKVEPEAGKLLIWPAYYTHAHRGNPVYKKTKYIATGWVVGN